MPLTNRVDQFRSLYVFSLSVMACFPGRVFLDSYFQYVHNPCRYLRHSSVGTLELCDHRVNALTP